MSPNVAKSNVHVKYICKQANPIHKMRKEGPVSPSGHSLVFCKNDIGKTKWIVCLGWSIPIELLKGAKASISSNTSPWDLLLFQCMFFSQLWYTLPTTLCIMQYINSTCTSYNIKHASCGLNTYNHQQTKALNTLFNFRLH